MASFPRKIQRTSLFRKLLSSPVFCVILIIINVMLIKSVWGLYNKAQASTTAKETSEKELKSLLDRKAFVESEIDRLKTPEGMEGEIRRKFNVARPGEEMVIVVNEIQVPETPIKETFFQNMINKADHILKKDVIKRE